MESRVEKLAYVNYVAAKVYYRCLQKSSRASVYVYSRVGQETAKQFKLGYAAPGILLKEIEEKRIDYDLALELGLVYTDKEGYAVERFSNRIMFPIVHAGQVIGFGGRTLSSQPDVPKYVNSSTSPLFSKRSSLYGLWKTRKSIVDKNYVIIVEGYFDILGLYANRIQNSVAVCGTSFTEEQALLLRRYTDRVYLMFDGDHAGKKAAVSAKLILSGYGMYKGRIELPEGIDPDVFVAKHGAKGLKTLKIIK
jgi:DNA primase